MPDKAQRLDETWFDWTDGPAYESWHVDCLLGLSRKATAWAGVAMVRTIGIRAHAVASMPSMIAGSGYPYYS